MYEETFQVINTSQTGPDLMFGFFGWFVVFAIYFYFSFMMSKIAYKCGCGEYRWWAYVPILNTLLLIKMADKPMWWFFLLLVPIVNIISFFILWMAAAKNAGQPSVWGFLMMVPLLNFLAVFILAYNNKKYDYPTAPTHPAQPSEGGHKPPQPSEPTFPRDPQNVR